MAKLIYSAIASLDGYVADDDGNFDWAEPDEEVHGFVNELERRLNAPEDPEIPSYEHVISSNGHGRLEHAGTMPGPGPGG